MNNILTSRLIVLRNLNIQSLRNIHSHRLLANSNLLSNAGFGKRLALNNIQIRYDSSEAASKFPDYKMVDATSVGGQNPTGNFMSDSPIVQSFEEMLISLHDSGAFDWSTTVMLATIAFRLAVCFPFRVYQERINAKAVNLQPYIKQMIEKRNISATTKEDLKYKDSEVIFYFVKQKIVTLKIKK